MSRKPLKPKSPLKELPKDKRDFKLGYSFSLPALSEIPATDWLVNQPLAIKNQGDTDMCTAYALAAVLEDHENLPLAPGYTFAKTKQLEGNYLSWGADLRTSAKTAPAFGALPNDKDPYPDQARDYIANWQNWPSVYDNYASPHKQQSYFLVEGQYDTFDNIRASLWYFRNSKNSVVAGSYWYYEWNDQTYIDSIPSSQPSAHAFKVLGQKIRNGIPYLVVQNSYGEGVGDNGLQYFSREVVNKEWKAFGQFMFVDIDPEIVNQQKISILQQLVRLYQQVIYLLTIQKSQTAPIAPAVEPQPQPQPQPEPETLQAMVKRVCREEGLTTSQWMDLHGTIGGESGWNPQAKNINTNGTGDYGLCQLNSYWYIGPTKEVKTPAEALANPEKCVRVMAKAWRNGRMNDWIAYKNGSYLKHRPQI